MDLNRLEGTYPCCVSFDGVRFGHKMHLKIADTRAVNSRSTILIVEDNFIIALSLEEDLKDAGFLAGSVANVADAFAEFSRKTIDAVLLDVDLGSELSFPLAAYLTMHKIPFAFLTSFPAVEIRRVYPMAEIFEKPADIDAVIAGLQALILRAGVRPQPVPSSFPS